MKKWLLPILVFAVGMVVAVSITAPANAATVYKAGPYGCKYAVDEPHISTTMRIKYGVYSASYHVFIKCTPTRKVSAVGHLYRCHFKPHGPSWTWTIYGCRQVWVQNLSGSVNTTGVRWNVPYGESHRIYGKGWYGQYTQITWASGKPRTNVTLVSKTVLNAHP